MKKEIKEAIKLNKMTSPITPYYLKGIASARSIVDKFMKKPSFTDKLK